MYVYNVAKMYAYSTFHTSNAILWTDNRSKLNYSHVTSTQLTLHDANFYSEYERDLELLIFRQFGFQETMHMTGFLNGDSVWQLPHSMQIEVSKRS